MAFQMARELAWEFDGEQVMQAYLDAAAAAAAGIKKIHIFREASSEAP